MLIHHNALYCIILHCINLSSLPSPLLSPPVNYLSNNNYSEAAGSLLNLFCSKVNPLEGPPRIGIITTMIASILCACVGVCEGRLR